MTKLNNLKDFYNAFYDELDSTLRAWAKTKQPVYLTLRQQMYDTCLLFADEHKIPGLIGALKSEARTYVERLAKEMGKSYDR